GCGWYELAADEEIGLELERRFDFGCHSEPFDCWREVAPSPRPLSRREREFLRRPFGSRLSSLELRHALLLIGGDAFLGVVTLEEKLLQLALDGERRLDRQVPTRLHRALDAAHGLRGLVRRHELAGRGADLLAPRPPRCCR